MKRRGCLVGATLLLWATVTGCQGGESSSPTTSGLPPPSTSSSKSPPQDDFNIATVGPPIPDIPRFTVDGQMQTIRDWWDKLKSGQCESLLRDTTVYTVDSDNARATHALAFLYRGAAHACLQEWRLAANNLAGAAACRDDLTSIGNSDQEQPLELLDWAINLVEEHDVQVGEADLSVCYTEPTESFTDTPSVSPTGEVSPAVTSTP